MARYKCRLLTTYLYIKDQTVGKGDTFQTKVQWTNALCGTREQSQIKDIVRGQPMQSAWKAPLYIY